MNRYPPASADTACPSSLHCTQSAHTISHMDSIKRVRLTFRHQEADRVPIDFGGWLSGIKKSAHDTLSNYLSIGDGGWNVCSPAEEILQHFQIDFRRITPGTPAYAANQVNEDGSVTDEWGITRIVENEDDQIVDFPLVDADTAGLDAYPWPEASGKGRYDNVLDAAKKIHERGLAVSAQPDINGVFELACWLCGFDRILMDMAMNPDFISALFEKITVLQERFARNYYSVVEN